MVAVLLLVASAVQAPGLADQQLNATDMEPQLLIYEAAVADGRIPELARYSTAESDPPAAANVRARTLLAPTHNQPVMFYVGLLAAIVLTFLSTRRRGVTVPSVRGRLLQDGRLLRCLEEASRRRRDPSTGQPA